MIETIKRVPKSGYLSLQKFKGKLVKITEIEIQEKQDSEKDGN